MEKLTIEYVDPKSLKISEYNAKEHPEEQIVEIVQSIQNFGFSDVIGVDENDTTIFGAGRLLAAKKMMLDSVPIVRIKHLTLDQKRAYSIAHSKLTMNSGFNLEKLKEGFEALDEELKRLTGFTEEETSEVFDKLARSEQNISVPDEAPSFTRKGDIWKIGEHRLLCGSSTESESYDKLLEGKLIDIVLTDPPYNVDYSTKNEFLNSLDNGARLEKDIKNDKIENFDIFIGDFFKNSSEKMKPGSPIYLFYAHSENTFITEFDKYLFRHQVLTWNKEHTVLSRVDYHPQTEPIIYGWKEGAAHKWYGGYSTSDVLKEDETLKSKLNDLKKKSKGELLKLINDIVENQPIKADIFYHPKPSTSSLHPTMKPVNLLKRLLRNSSIRGDLVFDGFAGSGSTLMACEELGRISYNIELDEHYCDVIVQRYIDYKKSKNEDYTITLVRDGIETPYDQLDMSDKE